MTNEWMHLVGQAYEANADEFALEDRHLDDFEHVRTEPDGSVVVQIDRHPALGGRTTVGCPSPAFWTIRWTFRIAAADPRFEVESQENLGFTFDADVLAAEEFENFWDVNGNEIRKAVAALGDDEAITDVCEHIVERWDVETTWESEYAEDDDIASAAAEVRAALLQLVVERVRESGREP